MKKLIGLFFRGISFILVYSPPWVSNFVGTTIGFLWWDVFRIRRKIVIENLRKAFPQKSDQELEAMGAANLRFLGRSLLSYAEMPFLNLDRVNKKFIFEGLENIEIASQKNKGVFILTLHLGNGDLGIGAMSVKGYPMYLVAKEMSVGWLNQMLLHVRERLGTVFIPPRNTAYQILKALKKNKLVVFVLDQYMGKPIGCKTKFFGHDTGTAMGLAVLAQRSEAPVITCYTYVDDQNRNVVVFGPEIPFETSATEQETIQKMTQKYSDRLEQFILKYPTQWMWIHRRWKNFDE